MLGVVRQNGGGSFPIEAVLSGSEQWRVEPYHIVQPAVDEFCWGTLDARLHLPLVSGLLGLGIDASVLERLERVSQLAIESMEERFSTGNATGIDYALEQLLGFQPTGGETLQVLLQPEAGPALVAAIPDLMTARALKKAGFSKELIQALQDGARMAALAASWREMCLALTRWDILSSLVERVCLLRLEDGHWVSGRRPVEGSVRWSCLHPRSGGKRALSAVAVRFTDVRDNVESRANDTGRNGAPGVVESAWATFCESRAVSVHDWVGDHGIAIFESTSSALAFATEASEAFAGPYELPIGTRGGTVAVRQGLRVGVGLSHGLLTGGTDGRTSRLEGPIVSTSMALAGTGMLDGAAEETGGYRRAVNGRTGLRSEGLVVCPEFLEALCVAHESQGVTIRGPVVPGGDGRGFEFFPVLCWWESMSGSVVAMGLGGGQRGGTAAELVDLDVEEFQAFCDADKVAGRAQRSSQVMEGAAWGQFADEELEQRTDDIDAVFLGRPEEPEEDSSPPIFAPDPIAMVARGDSSLERGGGVVSAPMMIEPLPEQGSGPRDAEQPGPAVFIDDDWDEGGWEENSWEDESWAELTGESEPRVPAPEPRALQAALQELRESYVIVRSEQSFFFGRLDGPSLKDAHQCDTKGDIVAAYKSLLVHHQEQRRGERRSQILGIQGDWLPESLDQAILEQAVVELDW